MSLGKITNNIPKIIGFIAFVCLVSFWFWDDIIKFYAFVSGRENIKEFITSYGAASPLVFVAMQVLQVIFAPVPGEATGFIGGYIFGVNPGFLYSSLGLTIGSVINFYIGRFLGKKFIRRHISESKLEKIDGIVRHKGALILFLLFVFPGFPKDYLCLILGVTTLPFSIFILLAVVGRMPGTYALSLQGSYVYEEMYGEFFILFGCCALVGILCYLLKGYYSRFIERFNRQG